MKKALSLVLACTMLLSMLVFSPAAVAEDTVDDPVVTRFAVVSDVHTNLSSTKTTIDRLPKVFDTAYAYAEDQGGTIDAFVFNGDSVNGGNYGTKDDPDYRLEEEWETFLAGVRDNVKEGSKVMMSLARTHDIYEGDGNEFFVETNEINALIKEYLGEDGSIIPTADWGYDPHLTDLNGTAVITLSNDMNNGILEGDKDDDNADNNYGNSEEWLDETLAELVEENAERPIFVVFHYPEVGKLGWTQRWGQNGLRDTLNKYPQVIAINAHVHWDPRLSDAITQDLFTEVYDGAIRDTGGPTATTVAGGSSPITSYSIVEVTKSGAVTIKYIDPETGDLLEEANGSGEVLEYSIPKAWDKSTYLYTDEAKFATEKATFAEDASIKLENGKTLVFDRADSEHPIIRYRVDVTGNGKTTTQYVFSELYNKELPESYSTTLALKTGVDYTVTVTAIDGIYRESANTLTLTGTVNDPDQTLVGKATAVIEKTYGENGVSEGDYPDFKTYATNPDAETITNWGISDMEDLKAWSEFSKSNSCTGLTFHLKNDIDMKDEIFNMIGSLYVPFKGKFDGHLHTVSNLLIDDTSGMGTGFFVYTVDAEIKNFGIESGLVMGHNSNRKYENTNYDPANGKFRTPFVDVIGVGAIAGRADSTDFYHVWNGADVTFRAGHLGYGNYLISNACYAGIAGRAQLGSTFVGCYNTGDVTAQDRASGITNWAQNGVNAARISNCFNTGLIDAPNSTAIALYGDPDAKDNSYFCFNNYYLEGSAKQATNRASATGYAAAGAEEPIALTAEEIKTDLADLLNAKRAYGALADDAEWDTDAEGNVYIKSVDNNVTENVVTISTAAELNDFATKSKTNSYEGYTVVLKADIDLSGTTNFAGIGYCEIDSNKNTLIADTACPFKGTFDGNGYTISGINLTSANSRGLFNQITDGSVKNLTVSNANIASTGYCGIIACSLAGTVNFDNVHIKNSSITANANQNGGFAAVVSNGGSYTIQNCTIDGLTVDGFTNLKQQSAGFVAGSAYGVTLDHCIIKNSTISAHRNAGLLVSYANGTTVKNLISYGNTLKCNTNSIGLIGGQLQNPTTLENCIFYPTAGAQNVGGSDTTTEKNCTTFTLFGYQKLDKTVTATHVYTTAASDTTSTATVISTTEAKLSSGEVAYNVGFGMENGYITFADEDTAAAKRYTYVIDEDTTEYRYTDATGNLIGTAPEATAEKFLGWNVTAGTKAGDLVYTAYYGDTDDGTYPISDMASHPKATKFTISTAEEFCTLATLSKSNTFEGYTFTLLNDIDMSSVENFAMIGCDASRFTANFDGGNHTIYNLQINNGAETNTGLFSVTGVDKTKNVTIKDLTIEDATVKGGVATAILIGKAYGVTLIENVKLRYSTATGAGEATGGFFGKVDDNTTKFTVKNCVVEGCKVSNVSGNNQQAGLIVGGESYHVTVENCLFANNTVDSHRQVGLICGFANDLTVNGMIAYGNTINCNRDSGGIIGRAKTGTNIQNIVAYNNTGTKRVVEGSINPTTYCYFARYDTDKPTITGSNLYNDIEDPTASPATVNTVTTAQIKSGEVAYKLGYAMEYGNITFPDSNTAAAKKYTYTVNGCEVDARYTDGNGDMIGTAPALPENAATTEWVFDEATLTYSTTVEYDKNGTYPITQYQYYSEAKNFSVSTAEEFKIFADLVNAKKIGSDITIKQTADIDLKDYPNVQVGTTKSADAAFAGTYDGQNYTISNYTLTKTDSWHGLFKALSGTIKNLTIDKANVIVASHSGILVGVTYGTDNLIDNVHIKNSTMTAKNRRGAFITYGFETGAFTIKNCTVCDCKLNVGSDANQSTGLIAIKADSATPCVIENSYVFNNDITLGLAHNCGNIVGDGRGTQGIVIKNCGSFNNNYLGSVQPSNLYGINAGSNANNSISNCYTDEAKLAAGTFTGSNNYAGVTEAELADGSLAYKLKNGTDTNWVQKDYPQVAEGKTVTAYNYLTDVDGETHATLYTDYQGNPIGEVTTTPTKAGYLFGQWKANEDNTAMIAQWIQSYDVDKDGSETLTDVIRLLQHLVGHDVDYDSACADVNKDNRVSIYDAVCLLKHISK